MIHVEHLHKSFGNVHAVAGISFDVAKGEVVGLLGPNGAGKTTAMRIITSYLEADSGTVKVAGLPVDSYPEKTKELIGYLPENSPLYPDMEVIGFLEYAAKLRGVQKNSLGDRIARMVEVCGLSKVVGRSIGELSRGYCQRVGLAGAMIHEPPVLILDEPTSGLDPNQIVEIRNLIKEIGRERTVILSTHILQEVEATCSRSLIINNGTLVGHGTLDELAMHAKGESVYITLVRGTKEEIEKSVSDLDGLEPINIFEEGELVRIMLRGGREINRSEDIFSWVVKNNWILSELRREVTSLEDVFRELTKQ